MSIEFSDYKDSSFIQSENLLYSKYSFFTIDELYLAYCNCKKGKNSMNTLKFEINFEENLFNLLKDLNNNTYEISRAICFVVEKPKIREIWASDFRDRVVHHLITRKIENFYEDSTNSFSFLENSYANRKNKGTHFAVNKLKKLTQSNKYYLKLDIESFFNSIDREVLFNILKDDLRLQNFENKDKIFFLFNKIIFHKYTNNYKRKSSNDLLKKVPFNKSLFSSEPINKGLPIGNLTSQFLSNVYLNKLDHFIVNKLGFKNYIRYVDDFVILSNKREELENVIFEINNFLKLNLKLKLHPKKIILNQVDEGIDFLGFFVKDKYTLVRKNVVKNLKEKLYYFYCDKPNKKLKKDEVIKLQNIVNSYYGHFKHAKSYNLKWKMSKKLEEYFSLEKKGKNVILEQKDNLNFENVTIQYLYFKKKYKNYLIVFQMGNFYRFFNEQANYISKKLNLKTQIRKYSKKDNLICGFPINSKKYIKLIEDLNINFIIVKQLNNELSSGLKERIEKKIVSNKKNLFLNSNFNLNQVKVKTKDLDLPLTTDLYIKLDRIILLLEELSKNGKK